MIIGNRHETRTGPDQEVNMRGIRETVTRWMEYRFRERPPHPAAIVGLYLVVLLLIWSLPGSLAPGLFGGGNTYPFIVFEYGGVYLLTAALFGCSAALLFSLARGLTDSGVRAPALPALAVALFLLYLLPAGLTGSMQMELPFYVPGWEHFGVSLAADAVMSAVIFLSGIGLLSLAVIAPFLLFERHFTMKRPYATVLALGTLLFPCLMTTIFSTDSIPSVIPWLSLSLSTLSVFCFGIAGGAVLCIPLAVYYLLKGSGNGNPPRQARVFGLFLLCMLLVWFVPGHLEPGLFATGHDYPDPGLKMRWFIPYGPGNLEYPWSTVPTIEGNYLIDMNVSPAGPISIFSTCTMYTREHTEDQYIAGQHWYKDEWTFRSETKRVFESLAGIGEVSEATLDLGDHLLAAGLERSEAERGYPVWLFANETTRGYILTYERPFDGGRSNDFFIVYYGTYGEIRSSDPDRSLKALIAQRLSPSAIRDPGEEPGRDRAMSRMPEAEPFEYISRMIRFAGVLLLTPILFGCSVALLFAGVRIRLRPRTQ